MHTPVKATTNKQNKQNQSFRFKLPFSERMELLIYCSTDKTMSTQKVFKIHSTRSLQQIIQMADACQRTLQILQKHLYWRSMILGDVAMLPYWTPPYEICSFAHKMREAKCQNIFGLPFAYSTPLN